MNENTKQDCLKLATHFLKVRLTDKGIPVTPKNIKQALITSAPDYRPAYWRRLRCALVTQQREAGFIKAAEAIKATCNPVTAADAPVGIKSQKKAKQKRRKHVEREEHLLLKRHLNNKGDRCLLAMIEIARILGCRPTEMMSLQVKGDNQTFITGAKKREDGLRGLDRTVILSTTDFETVNHARLTLLEYRSIKGLTKEQLQKRLQRRLATATKQLWPRRRHQITLYSYRHQLGSDLKASGMDRTEVAAVMGHQSVDSVDVYGNKCRSSRNLSITATAESIASVRKTQLKNQNFIADKKAANDNSHSRVHHTTLKRF